MGLFPKGVLCLNRRKRKSEPCEYSEEELDEQGMRDLEATLSQSSGIVILRGEKLRRYEQRMDKLSELFRRTAVMPARLVPLEDSRRASIHASMHSRHESTAAGPSQSLDSAQDFVHRTASDHELNAAESRSYSTHSRESNAETENEGRVEVPQPVRTSPERVPEMVAESVPVASRTALTADSPMFSKEPDLKVHQMESDASEDEEISAGLLLDSVQADSVLPDTATTTGTIPLADMNDWNRFRHLTSFSEFNTPLPMKVSSFVDLQTQCVASSRAEESDRSPQPRTPEKDDSTTDGLLFSVDSFDMPLYLHTTRASSSATTETEVDYECALLPPRGIQIWTCLCCRAGEVLLKQFRGNKPFRDHTFRSSRVSVSPNFPVNVWDDVPPTRLHIHPINV